MSTIRRYTDDFKRDAVHYVEEHPNMTVQQATAAICRHSNMKTNTIIRSILQRKTLRNGQELSQNFCP